MDLGGGQFCPRYQSRAKKLMEVALVVVSEMAVVPVQAVEVA